MEADRRSTLISALESDGLDGLLISSETNVGYLTGFHGDSSTLLLTHDCAIIISDGRYTLQLAQECPDCEAHIRPIGQPMSEAVAERSKSLGIKRLGFESHATTVDNFHALCRTQTDVELVPTRGMVEALRAIKNPTEVLAIREAIAIAERAFLDLRDWLRPGRTEKAAADFLESTLRAHGAVAASFPPIVAVGRRAALPHARPTADTTLGASDLVLIDWGAAGLAYKSDLTRVLVVGKVAPEFESVYRAVLDAQQHAIAAIRPGVMARTIDAEARSVIEAAGFGRFFNHSAGHGIGRDVHEAPVLRSANETPLRAGMVVTIEPGIYLPDWGGIRIEDDVLVTDDGGEVLSTLPKSLESVSL
jgi:Xaa-Pro aminopeptidase